MKRHINNYVLIATLSFVLWGLFPLYFKLIYFISPFEIVAHRIIWSFVFMSCIVLISKGAKQLHEILQEKKILLMLLLASFFISANWLIFIYAVVNDRVLETSLGYFISPLITIFLGLIFLKEKIGLIKKIAIALTIIALSIKIIMFNQLSYVTIGLALSFSAYALIKKQIHKKNSTTLFFVETAILCIPALVFWFYLLFHKHSVFNSVTFNFLTFLLILGLGLLTSTPLLLFNYSVRHINLSIIGFIQYITPSMTFFTAIILFKEPFLYQDFIVFLLIWIAIAMASIDNNKNSSS